MTDLTQCIPLCSFHVTHKKHSVIFCEALLAFGWQCRYDVVSWYNSIFQMDLQTQALTHSVKTARTHTTTTKTQFSFPVWRLGSDMVTFSSHMFHTIVSQLSRGRVLSNISLSECRERRRRRRVGAADGKGWRINLVPTSVSRSPSTQAIHTMVLKTSDRKI